MQKTQEGMSSVGRVRDWQLRWRHVFPCLSLVSRFAKFPWGYLLAFILPHVSFSDTVRLNIRCSGVESLSGVK